MGRLPPSSGGASNNTHHAASSSSSSANPAQLFRVDDDAGVIPRAFADIFQSIQAKKLHLQQTGYGELEYQVSIQFLELYGESIRDLLTSHRNHNDQKLTVRDLGQAEPEVVGATQQPVSTPQEALQCLAHGMLRRVTGATAMNESSSRSHAILSVCVEQSVVLYSNNNNNNSENSDTNNENSNNPANDPELDVQVTRSKFSCVDLAGAERVKRTGATGTRLQEGIDINKGLLVLGQVVSYLGDPSKRGKHGKHTHVPYRDSKLTRLLKGSLGGNHKTLMIACVSPAACNMGESLNCLRYANRAKNIQNKAVLNVDANTKRVQELQTQVQTLAKDLLLAMDNNGDDKVPSQFTREVLATLAEGNTAANVVGGGGFTPIKNQQTPAGKLLQVVPQQQQQQQQSPIIPAPKRQQSANDNTTASIDNASTAADRQKLQQVQEELYQTREQLRQSQAHHDAAELELQTVRAQNTWCDVQIAALTSDENGGQSSSGNVIEKVEEVFRDRALEYEEEIGALRQALRRATTRMAVGSNDNFENDDDDDARILAEEEQRLGQAKERWMELRAELSPYEQAPHPGNGADSGEDALNDTFDVEEQKEQAALDHLTQKYLVNIDDDDDEVLATTGDGEVDPENEDPPTAARALSPPSNNATREPQVTQVRLDELSHNIATKERLIKQIKRNKEREVVRVEIVL